MNLNDTTFVIGTMQSNSPNGPVSHPLNYNIENNNNNVFIEKNKYEESINYTKQFLFYKVFDLQFQKALTFKFEIVSLHVGDIIDFITKTTGIKKLIVWLTKGNCGCEARRIKFNEWFKIKLPILKFQPLMYSDIVNLKRHKNIKLQENKFKEYHQLNSNKTQKEIEKQKIFEQLYGSSTYSSVSQTPEQAANNPKSSTNKKQGCGCEAKKQLKKNVNIV